MKAKECDIKIVTNDETLEIVSSYAYQTENGDEVQKHIDRVCTNFELILSLFEDMEVELGLLVLDAKDDNAKEIAQSVKRFVASQANKVESAFNESDCDDEDWYMDTHLGLLRMLTYNGKETLVIPNLRRDMQDLCEDDDDDFTEDFFNKYLEKTRKKFGLSEDFQ